jgi:hypothetical protein
MSQTGLPKHKQLALEQMKKGLGVLPIPPSRLGNRKRMWEFVHDLTAPDANEELTRVRSLAYKRLDREPSESRYLLKWLRPRCPRLSFLDDEHQKMLLTKIEVLQFNDNDVYKNTCGVLVRGWMIKQGQTSGQVLGPGTCVDCDGTDITYECWYGEDDLAPDIIDRNRRKSHNNLLFAAGGFSKQLKALKKVAQKWKKKGHTRITEVIAFPIESWKVVLESQRIDNTKKYAKILKINSKILGSWSSNRLFKLCDSGIIHTCNNVGDLLFRQNDELSKKPSAFLVLTGALRIQIRFTLKEAQKFAPKGVDYYCPPKYHNRTVVTLISIVKSGDCLRAISIVDDLFKSNEFNDGGEFSDSSSDEELEVAVDSDQEMEEINLMDPEEQVWRKIFIVMQNAMIKPIQLFHEIDIDDSGLISPTELREGLLNIVGMELTNDEFKNVLKKIDRDNSGEIDYKELSHAIKYGDPQRIKSMEEQEAKLIKLAEINSINGYANKRKQAQEAKLAKRKAYEAKKARKRAMMLEVPVCEAVAEVPNTSILEIHKDSEAAALLRRTGMARKLLEVDIAKFNRENLIREWVRHKHATQHLKNGLEETMGPRAKNRREKDRRDSILKGTKGAMERQRQQKSGSPVKRTVPRSSSPFLPVITSPSPTKKNPLSARQLTVVSDMHPYQSKSQFRRFQKVVNDIRSSVPTMGFNPIVLWEEDQKEKGELLMKVITKDNAGNLAVNLYPTKIGEEDESEIHRYLRETEMLASNNQPPVHA